MKQLYVRAVMLDFEFPVCSKPFEFDYGRWYPVTGDKLIGYIVDNAGNPYILDLSRLPENTAWESVVVEVNLK